MKAKKILNTVWTTIQILYLIAFFAYIIYLEHEEKKYGYKFDETSRMMYDTKRYWEEEYEHKFIIDWTPWTREERNEKWKMEKENESKLRCLGLSPYYYRDTQESKEDSGKNGPR